MDPTPATSLVEFRQVAFGYGERAILDGVSFTVPRGKVTALMGASGGGKTTVLRLIGGQLRARHGEVRVNGEDIGKLAPEALYAARRRMGMLFQFGALFTDLTVFENVAFPLREHTDLPESMVRDIVLMKLNAVGLRGAARDGEAQARVGEVVATQQFADSVGELLVLVLQRNEQNLARVPQTLEMFVETKSLAAVAAHRGEHDGGVEQAGVAHGDSRVGFFDKLIVEPGVRRHRGGL